MLDEINSSPVRSGKKILTPGSCVDAAVVHQVELQLNIWKETCRELRMQLILTKKKKISNNFNIFQLKIKNWVKDQLKIQNISPDLSPN